MGCRTKKVLGMVDTYQNVQNLPLSAYPMYKIQHIKCSGATTFHTLWRSTFQLTIFVSPFHCFKHNLIDYGFRNWVQMVPNKDNLTQDHHLPSYNIWQTVCVLHKKWIFKEKIVWFGTRMYLESSTIVS